MDFRQGLRPQVVCLLTTCFLSSLVGISLVYLGNDSQSTNNMPSTEQTNSIKPAAVSSSQIQKQPVRYIMRNHGGRLAVFEAQEDSPRLVFDVYINTLPEYDQELLQEGVSVEGEDALTKLIEDYIS
jgi:hypothetical protein